MMTIRPATVSDAPAMARVQIEGWLPLRSIVRTHGESTKQ